MPGATMYDSGKHVFRTWAKQLKMPDGKVFYNKWLGEFDPSMSGELANALLDHCDKLTLDGQKDFIRGWKRAQKIWRAEKCKR